MPDYLIVLIVSGVFILLGFLFLAWGSREESGYDNFLSRQRDLREFIYGWPNRPEAVALKIGGWVSFTLGLVSLALSLIFWLRS
jgi:hypothetical protein